MTGKAIQGLLLKDLAIDQAQNFFDHIQANRSAYLDHIPFVSRTLDVETMRQNIARNVARQEQGLSEFYTLWAPDKMAGYFLIREKDLEARWAEIGYMLGTPWQGKGISGQICRLLMEDLFVCQAMEKIVICCHDQNIASMGLAKKLGFTLEGNLRNHNAVNGTLRNMLYFGLLKNEWLPHREASVLETP